VSQQHFCIYHANCADGFGAAWVMREWYKREGWVQDHGVDLKFIPAAYQDSPPVLPRGATVKILDFSYKKDALLRMADQVGDEGTIVILDHHKTAQADLANFIDDACAERYSHLRLSFDMNQKRCSYGVGLLLQRWQTPCIHSIISKIVISGASSYGPISLEEIQQATLFSIPYDFDTVWDELIKYEPVLKVHEDVREKLLLRKHFKDINELLPTVTMQCVLSRDTKYLFCKCTVHVDSSDAGNISCANSMIKTEFAVCYWDIPRW
jgi:hypothetical protein